MGRHLAAALAALAFALVAVPASAANFGPRWVDVSPFAYLPDGVRYPEGITADPVSGDIIVGTFDFGPNTNKLLRYANHGALVSSHDFGGTPLLGLGFANGKVYMLAFGAGQVLRMPASFDAATPVEVFANVPTVGAPTPRSVPNPDGSNDTIAFGFSGGARAPNGMVFDRWGNLYFSDSFQGAIFRITGATTCTAPCAVTLVSHDPLLATAGFPPFGANGLAVDPAATTLYIANTGDNRVLKMNLVSNEVSVLAESVHGADGLLLDDAGRLWVAANQGDEIVALDTTTGRVIMRAGQFDGIRSNGAPRGLLFPASMVISDGWMYVTNLALPLTSAVGDEPEEDVTRWSVARFRVPRAH